MSPAVSHAVTFRSIDGSGNNLANPDWGQANTELLRLSDAAYDDGLSSPRGGEPSTLPSARAISNAVAPQTTGQLNAAYASDWLWQWGQFLDHDIDLTEAAHPAEAFNIPVPTGDVFFDPGNTGTQEIGLNRSISTTDGSGVRQQINQITSFIDGSNVYGSDTATSTALREGVGGRMAMTPDGLLTSSGGMFLSGDIRANEQIGLTATHTLFSREHNRLADELKARLDAGDVELTQKFVASGMTEDEFLYQATRKVIGAYMQKITYEEFLPVLLGKALNTYDGYDDAVNPSIANEFSTAFYRVGHTMLSPTLRRVNPDGTTAAEGNVALRDAFFNPGEIVDHGIDSLLLGLAYGRAQEIDTQIIDDVRNFLFGPPGSGGFDLASLNIQRGRDHGLPGLNAVRLSLGLEAYDSFLELTGGDVDLAAKFASVYDHVDDVDLWIGGLAERHVHGGLLGETFYTGILDQFTRLRDGDRYFYLSEMDHILALDAGFESTRLSDIIRRNTDIQHIQGNVFVVLPEPATALLGGLALAGLAMRRRRV